MLIVALSDRRTEYLFTGSLVEDKCLGGLDVEQTVQEAGIAQIDFGGIALNRVQLVGSISAKQFSLSWFLQIAVCCLGNGLTPAPREARSGGGESKPYAAILNGDIQLPDIPGDVRMNSIPSIQPGLLLSVESGR